MTSITKEVNLKTKITQRQGVFLRKDCGERIFSKLFKLECKAAAIQKM